MPGKRSDPTQLRREREQIVKDMEQRLNVPQEKRMYPNLLEQGRRILEKAAQRKREKKYPPPVVEGAKVVGFKKPSNTA